MSVTELKEGFRSNEAANRECFALTGGHKHLYFQEDVVFCRKFETISVSDYTYNSQSQQP